MGFDIFRFMASPQRAVEEEDKALREAAKPQKWSRRRDPDVRLPWFVSVVFFVFIARVLLGDAILLGLSWMGDPLPGWFNALLAAHVVAVIAALVFVLNGWGWARVALLVLSLAQLGFDSTLITRWFLLADALLLVVLVIKPSNQYFINCADYRARPR